LCAGFSLAVSVGRYSAASHCCHTWSELIWVTDLPAKAIGGYARATTYDPLSEADTSIHAIQVPIRVKTENSPVNILVSGDEKKLTARIP
jgi:hypothetical protein